MSQKNIDICIYTLSAILLCIFISGCGWIYQKNENKIIKNVGKIKPFDPSSCIPSSYDEHIVVVFKEESTGEDKKELIASFGAKILKEGKHTYHICAEGFSRDQINTLIGNLRNSEIVMLSWFNQKEIMRRDVPL